MTDKEMILDSLKKNNGVIETKQFAERGIDNIVTSNRHGPPPNKMTMKRQKFSINWYFRWQQVYLRKE